MPLLSYSDKSAVPAILLLLKFAVSIICFLDTPFHPSNAEVLHADPLSKASSIPGLSNPPAHSLRPQTGRQGAISLAFFLNFPPDTVRMYVRIERKGRMKESVCRIELDIQIGAMSSSIDSF